MTEYNYYELLELYEYLRNLINDPVFIHRIEDLLAWGDITENELLEDIYEILDQDPNLISYPEVKTLIEQANIPWPKPSF